MSLRVSLRKLCRKLGRPFERLAKKLKAKFQRSVLKTIERNPGCIQAIVQGTSPTNSHSCLSSGSNMDALLLAFIRSSQRNRKTRNDFPRLSDAGDTNGIAFATFKSNQDLLARKESLVKLLRDPDQQMVLLQLAGDVDSQALQNVRDNVTQTHQSQLYISHESGASGCICLFERKAA